MNVVELDSVFLLFICMSVFKSMMVFCDPWFDALFLKLFWNNIFHYEIFP